MLEFPKQLAVVIEVPLGGFIKRRDDGSIDFISPAPCPFNYGSVPDTCSGDGDRLDAVVLGPRLRRGSLAVHPVVACVRFVDAGDEDPKWICSAQPLSLRERALIAGFFSLYAQAKTVLNALRRKPGATRYGGITLA